MKRTGKYVERQMNLLDTEEWRECNPPVEGKDVFHSSTGKVRTEWLSDCAEERVLTLRLLDEVVEDGNVEQACRRVIANGGSPGVDGMSTEDLSEWFSRNWRNLRDELRQGKYEPQPVLQVEIPKANGGTRKLGIPTVKDRLVQQAIHQVLCKRYERIFSDHSYGFRPNRNAHQALHRSSNYVSEGYGWIGDIDLEKFFDTVNHQRLMWLLSRRVGDKALLRLIHKMLKSGVLAGGLASQRIAGTPQGGPLSPLLSNVVLDELDKELERRGHRFVRYADDIRIYVRSKEAAQRVMESVSTFIEKRLRLRVNRVKSQVCRGVATNFLGHSFLQDGTLILSNTSEQRITEVLREMTSRKRGISLEMLLEEVNPKLRGWLNYFRFAQMKSRVERLTSWLQHRIRSFRLKQCKRTIGIARFLQKLGVPEWRSWVMALSGKGWWRLSATPQAHEAMNTKWFEAVGLYSLSANYQRLKLEETAVYVSMYGGVRGR
jgi:group II intron reverse transcriptase/maturase